MASRWMGLVAGMLAMGWASAVAAQPANCAKFGITPSVSTPLKPVAVPPTHPCATRISNGYALPDASCTPGAVNATVTGEILGDPGFHKSCLKAHALTDAQRAVVYGWYAQPMPANNVGAAQTCELNHLVPLDLGGTDTLDNIWPQCSSGDLALKERSFKQKDRVETYLVTLVKAGVIGLQEAQRGIAADWTVYLEAAKTADGAP